MATSDGGESVVLPPAIHAMVHGDEAALDADAPAFCTLLRASCATEIWHKHGSFYDHLHDVWEVLCVWGQPRAVCRLGLFHSAYSNSFVSMNLFDPNTDREKLSGMIGAEAENLVYKFCVIDRKQMEDMAVRTMAIPAEGVIFKHIRTGEPVECSAAEIGAFLVETIADYQDQSFGWQSDMEGGRPSALWPGTFKPTLRMAKLSRMAAAARACGHLQVVPPVFDGCARLLGEEDERAARDAYWAVVTEEAPRGEWEALLAKAAALNPDIGEPHVVRAQVLLLEERWDEAAGAARAGLDVLFRWGTQWDNRMPFRAWVAWARCMFLQAKQREWPSTHGGMESLGAVHPSQQFRGLSTSRSMAGE